MKKNNSKLLSKKISICYSLLIGGVFLGLLIAIFFLIKNIESARKAGVFAARAHITEQLFKHKQNNTTTVRDIDFINTWMTFQYINLLFDLPNNYLQNYLQITEVKYPNISVKKYCKISHTESKICLIQVKDAVQKYIVENPPKN